MFPLHQHTTHILFSCINISVFAQSVTLAIIKNIKQQQYLITTLSSNPSLPTTLYMFTRTTNPTLVRTRASVIPRSVKPLEKRLQPAPIHAPYTKAPLSLKKPYVVRPFQRDGHIASLQHIENRGMYKEELDIERARFPKLNKTVTIHCDGSMSEKEYEFTVPPVSVVFRDRHSVHLEQLAESRRLSDDRWRCLKGPKNSIAVCRKPKEEHEKRLNMLCFPYAVPTSLPMKAKPIVAMKEEDDSPVGSEMS